MAATKKNPGMDASNNEVPNFEGWVTEEVGFAPFWKPTQGDSLFGTLVARDERDPEFIRYLLIAGRDTKCHRGPGDGGEDVEVKKGEQLSMSVYVQLIEKFDEYLEFGFPVPVLITAKEKVKGGQGNVWLFDVKVSPETKAMLADARHARRMNAAKRAAEMTG